MQASFGLRRNTREQHGDMIAGVFITGTGNDHAMTLDFSIIARGH
jgi:hypothetical protein